MLRFARKLLRTGVQAIWRARQYPVLLPQSDVCDGALRTLDRPGVALDAKLAAGLCLCDGTRTLVEIVRRSGAGYGQLLALHDEGTILMWRGPVPDRPPTDVPTEAIIVSPHPDDAALCLGGLMLTHRPGAVIVLDVFTRTAWSRFPAELTDVARIGQVRDAEERMMARLAGAVLHTLDLPEAMLRQHTMGDVFQAMPTALDRDEAGAIAPAVAALARQHPAARWYLPLAVGNHLDHRLVRDVTTEALEREGVSPDHVRFYEDLPYADTLGGNPDFADAVPGRKLAPEAIDISDVWRWKLELNRVYWSQLTWSQIRKVGEYAKRIGGGRAVERVWGCGENGG